MKSSWYLPGLISILLVQAAWLYANFPTLEQYRPGADEGTYFRQAVTVLEHGFRPLGDEFVSTPAVQGFPNPLRVGHVALAAAAVAIDRSFTSLSVLSLVCHVVLSIVTFVFVRRWRGDPAALAAALLVSTSPFGMAAARRALMDAEYGLFTLVAALLFVTWTVNGRWRTFAWFLAALTWAALVKETTLFLAPAFGAAIIVIGLRPVGTIAWRYVAALALVPIAVGATYAVMFGLDHAVEMARITRAMNQPETNEYLRVYQSGPWASFFVDRFLLAPVATLAFLLLCGWHVASRRIAEPGSMLLILFGVGFAIFALLPQNPRFALPLDAMARIFTAMAIVDVAAAREALVRTLAIGVVAVMMLTDAIGFRQVFLRHDVYDPVTYNLAVSRGVLGQQPIAGPPNADSYLGFSAAYFHAKHFDAAIEMSARALKLRPDDATAYNNIGVSYNALGRWSDAIAALQMALKLKPDFDLARNNLRWAETELARSAAGGR